MVLYYEAKDVEIQEELELEEKNLNSKPEIQNVSFYSASNLVGNGGNSFSSASNLVNNSGYANKNWVSVSRY